MWEGLHTPTGLGSIGHKKHKDHKNDSGSRVRPAPATGPFALSPRAAQPHGDQLTAGRDQPSPSLWLTRSPDPAWSLPNAGGALCPDFRVSIAPPGQSLPDDQARADSGSKPFTSSAPRPSLWLDPFPDRPRPPSRDRTRRPCLSPAGSCPPGEARRFL